MKIEDIQKRDTVFINRDGGPKIGTVISVNKKKQRIFISYRKSVFGYTTEHRGYFKLEEITEVAHDRS